MKNIMELTVVILIIGILFVLSMRWIKDRNTPNKTSCLMNVHRIYNAMDQAVSEGYSMAASNAPFKLLASYGGSPAYLVCPEDNRFAAQTSASVQSSNVSYFINLDALLSPQTIISGDRNMAANPGVIFLSSNSIVRWIETIGLHGDQGHILFGDGHAQLTTSLELTRYVERLEVTNRILVP